MMTSFLAVDLSLVVLDGQPYAVRFTSPRTDKLVDATVTSPFGQFCIALGVPQDDRERLLETVHQLASEGGVIDVRGRGTGKEDAPSIIRPASADLAGLKLNH